MKSDRESSPLLERTQIIGMGAEVQMEKALNSLQEESSMNYTLVRE